MRYEWDDAKRKSNLKLHGYDFASAQEVFAGLTITYEDARFADAEQRFVTLGLLQGVPVSIVHTEGEEVIRVTSFRGATPYETQFLFQSIASELAPGKDRQPGPRRKSHGGASGAQPRPRDARRRKKGPKARPT